MRKTVTTVLLTLFAPIFVLLLSSNLDNFAFRSDTRVFNQALITICDCMSGRGKCEEADKKIEFVRVRLERHNIHSPTGCKSKKDDRECYYNLWFCYLSKISNLSKWGKLESARRIGDCVQAIENVNEKKKTVKQINPVIKSLFPFRDY